MAKVVHYRLPGIGVTSLCGLRIVVTAPEAELASSTTDMACISCQKCMNAISDLRMLANRFLRGDGNDRWIRNLKQLREDKSE